jgi:hypothetical protein
MRRLARNLASALIALALPLAAALAMAACSGDDKKEEVVVAVDKLTLPPTLDLVVGTPGSLTAILMPDNATNKAVEWTSSDTTVVAPPTATGLTVSLTALKTGETTITVVSKTDRSKTATCTVTAKAPVPVDSVTLSERTLTIRMEDQPVTITATVLPDGAANKELQWTNSDPTIAGMAAAGAAAAVTPVAPGTTTITVASASNPDKKAECVVTVLPVKPDNHDVYVAGYFGVYRNGAKDTRFPDYSSDYDMMEDVFVDDAGDVHAAGVYDNYWGTGNYEAAYYRNGARTILEMSYEGYNYETVASAIFVDGTDVYIAGYEWFDDGSDLGDVAPRLWKNGSQQYLESNEEDGWGEWCFADSVRVHNGDVYVGGFTDIVDGYDRAVIWKNGVEHIIMGQEYIGGWEVDGWQIQDFGVAPNGILYVLCYNNQANHWGIGPYSVWEVQPDLEMWTKVFEQFDTSTTLGMDIPHIFVEGTDWYIAGSIDYDGYYWKNGGEPVVLAHASDQWYVELDDIFVLDGDVYIAGCSAAAASHQLMSILVWKNGELTTDWAATEPINGHSNAVVKGLYVK